VIEEVRGLLRDRGRVGGRIGRAAAGPSSSGCSRAASPATTSRLQQRETTALGLDALVTQAGAMSEPVLTRLGVVAVRRVDMLVDDF
jgi:hypothetical protein